jgi:hypothetical protein
VTSPVAARRLRPGEYMLPAGTVVEVGLTFEYLGAVYEVIGEPRKWGVQWAARVKQVEGLRPGMEFQALLGVAG